MRWKKNKRIGKRLIELLKVKVLISGKQIMGFSLTVSHAPSFHGYTRVAIRMKLLVSQFPERASSSNEGRKKKTV